VSLNKTNRGRLKTDRNYYQDKTFKSKSAHKSDIKFKVDGYHKGLKKDNSQKDYR
jgi:hypothetical protein